MSEAILVVDDEESVRRTFTEWLAELEPGVTVSSVADAEAALRIASQQPVDLAILDWNLGSGSDGLQLLEDLVEFQPEIAAILVTGFAHQATPLQALRMGVRDYLDKNADLTRETFLAAVRRQLARIRPLKRQRELQRSLAAFREAVEQIIPYVQAAAVLQNPVPVPDAARDLLRWAIRITKATDGLLCVHVGSTEGMMPSGQWLIYRPDGALLEVEAVSFRQTLLATALSRQEPLVLSEPLPDMGEAIQLLPVERGRKSVLVAPMAIGDGIVGAIELFDKQGGVFTSEDVQVAQATADLGVDLLRRSLAERQGQKWLIDALAAALHATEQVRNLLHEDRPPPEVLEQIKQGLVHSGTSEGDSEAVVQLLEEVRSLFRQHGSRAVEYCTRMIRDLRQLLTMSWGNP
jgi:DNA-binding NarL/FixJ family response regulator